MTEKLPPKNDNPTIQTVDDTIKGDGELSYNILYEVQFKQWDLWGSFKNVDVAYITLTNKEDPIILIEKLIYKLGLDKKLPTTFKNSTRKGVKLLGTPKPILSRPRLEP